MMLSISGVRFSYNGHPVLRDIQLELDKGQILAVLGVNGAGKSTFLQCLNRILRVKKGQIRLYSDDVLRMKPEEIAAHMGYVPQRYGEEELSVFDAVLLGRKPYMKWRAEQRDLETVETTLGQMGLTHMAMRPVNTLSGGEMQKVILARALAQEPDLLLLDEPTSNLDLKNQLEVMDLVRKAVQDRELSAVICLHDINLAFRYADRFLMLKDGRVYTQGTRDAVTPEAIHQVYGVQVILGEVQGYPIVVAHN
ncbi:MAG: ABC transporter ATP-binding protein [Deltaproteobacteria bacterium]|nr:ABC transporter ATP-binding protein [Deltaproteobacteria bacterium]MCF8119591.1 ABC transporter ATP-binding protein [Deltaproteobacteria bacterium]